MSTSVEKRTLRVRKHSHLSDDDKKLHEDLINLVDEIVANRDVPTCLATLKILMQTSTTSMTAVPKPLKYLKDYYPKLKDAYRNLPDDLTKKKFADILSVLALASATSESHESLYFHLMGTLSSPGNWGHEYCRRLELEIVAEWTTVSLAKEEELKKKLLPVVKKIIAFDVRHNGEIQACDFCLELNQLSLLDDYLNENNYPKVCTYLISVAVYSEEAERNEILDKVVEHYLYFGESSKALITALQRKDNDLINECYNNCENYNEKRQLSLILTRMKDSPIKSWSIVLENENADNLDVFNNGYVTTFFHILIRELDILEPKTPDEIYKTWLETSYFRALQLDSARSNLAASFASAFVHAGFGKDKLMDDSKHCWVFKNKDHGMISATAALGLIHLWDVDNGLGAIDKFLYVTNEFVKAGALLAIGVVSVSMSFECDPALALLCDHITSPCSQLQLASIFGLSLAYAASYRTDLNDLILPVLQDEKSPIEVIAHAALGLGLINVASGNGDIATPILQRLIELNSTQLASTWSRFIALGLGFIYMGRRDNIETLTEALEALPNPYRLPAQTMIQICAYAGTGDVLIVQELLRICSEPVDDEDPKNGNDKPISNSNKKTDKSTDKPSGEIGITQSIATLGVALVGLSEGKENSRIFGQIGRYGTPPARKAMPLGLALTYMSNPDSAIVDILNKYCHDTDINVALNAIISLGLVGAGTNNARVALILRQLAAYHFRSAAHLFLVRIAQGLIHLGKGTMTLNPLKFSYKVLDNASLAGILIVLVSFLDCKNLILGDSHYLMYSLSLAMEPRWLITINAKMDVVPVSVRIGQAVDVIGKAGDPKSITGGHVMTTPVLMSYGERAELVNTEEYEPLVVPMEGFVILEEKKESFH